MWAFCTKLDLPGDVMCNFRIGREEQSSIGAWARGNIPCSTRWLCHESISSCHEKVDVSVDVCRWLRKESRAS